MAEYNYIQEIIDGLSPRERKKLSKMKSRVFMTKADGTSVLCCTFLDPAGLAGPPQRIDHIPRKEQEEMIQQYVMPRMKKAVEGICERDPAFREGLLRRIKEEEGRNG